MVWKIYLLLNMAIFGIYVKFPGGNDFLKLSLIICGVIASCASSRAQHVSKWMLINGPLTILKYPKQFTGYLFGHAHPRKSTKHCLSLHVPSASCWVMLFFSSMKNCHQPPFSGRCMPLVCNGQTSDCWWFAKANATCVN